MNIKSLYGKVKEVGECKICATSNTNSCILRIIINVRDKVMAFLDTSKDERMISDRTARIYIGKIFSLYHKQLFGIDFPVHMVTAVSIAKNSSHLNYCFLELNDLM